MIQTGEHWFTACLLLFAIGMVAGWYLRQITL